MTEAEINEKPVKGLRPIKSCKECGDRFMQSRHDQKFCSHKCNRSYFRRHEIRGGQAVERLMEWRIHRGRKGTPGEGAIGDIAAMVDEWLREDREAGRSQETGS